MHYFTVPLRNVAAIEVQIKLWNCRPIRKGDCLSNQQALFPIWRTQLDGTQVLPVQKNYRFFRPYRSLSTSNWICFQWNANKICLFYIVKYFFCVLQHTYLNPEGVTPCSAPGPIISRWCMLLKKGVLSLFMTPQPISLKTSTFIWDYWVNTVGKTAYVARVVGSLVRYGMWERCVYCG